MEKARKFIDDITALLAIAVIFLCVFFAPAYADDTHRRIHVDDEAGSDSNSGLYDTAPVTSSNGRWSRVVELGVMGADTGVVARNISDTPDAHWVRQAMKEKPDRRNRSDTPVEYIQNHGAMPTEYVEESEIANMRIRTTLIWGTIVLPNGDLAEKCVGVRETVEAY